MSSFNRFVILLLLCLAAAGTWGRGAQAAAKTQQAVPESLQAEQSATYAFAQSMMFALELTNDPQIEEATLFVSTPQFETAYTVDFQIEANDGDVLRLTHNIDLTQVRIQPFTTVTYWWRLQSGSGDSYELEKTTFNYDDDTFQWKYSEQANVEIFWVADGQDLGQVGLDVALESLPQILSIVPADVSRGIRIYLYPSNEDFQAALRLTGQDLITGIASPELGVIMLPAENPRTAIVDLRRRIPHEMAHLMVYEAADPFYDSVPRWFDEGLAAQFEFSPNPNYAQTLEAAISNNDLIPLAQLCDRLPFDDNSQLLKAYAQSESVVSYIRAEYGAQVLKEMIQVYAEGGDCDSAIEQVLGVSLSELERNWLRTISPSIFTRLGQNIFWIIVLLFGFVLTLILILRPVRR